MTTEVGGVQAPAEDRLVHLAQLGERELVGQQAMSDAAVADLVAQAPECVVDDVVVVEGEPGEGCRVEPAHVLPCIGGRDLVGAQERPVDDRYDAAGGPLDGSEGIQLLEIARCQPCGLAEGAGCRGIQALADVEPSSGKRPEALVRIAGAAYERQHERRRIAVRPAAEAEDHRRHGDARDVVRGAVRVGSFGGEGCLCHRDSN